MGIPFIDTARISKLLLFLVGIVLVIAGLAGILVDYAPDLVFQHSSATVLLTLLGMGVLVITTIVYVIMPNSYRRHRITRLREMYGDGSRVEKSMLHHLRETGQALVNNIEIVEMCCENSISGPREVRRENIRNAKARLPMILVRYGELKNIIDEFDAYVESRQDGGHA